MPVIRRTFRRWRVNVDGAIDSRNRPYVDAWWASETECGLTVSYGNRNTDPVWVVDVSRDDPPRWFAWICDRLDHNRV